MKNELNTNAGLILIVQASHLGSLPVGLN